MEKEIVLKQKESSFVETIDTIKNALAHDSSVQICLKSNREKTGGMCLLEVDFIKDPNLIVVDRDKKKEVIQKIENILKENNMELSGIYGQGNWGITYRIDKKFVDGKINWRRWLPYPEHFSVENLALLDEAAIFTELQEILDGVVGDSLSRFTAFVRVANGKGLINDKEKRKIEQEYYSVANA